MHLHQAIDHRPLPSPDGCHIHCRLHLPKAKFRSPSKQRDDLCRINNVLAGQAGDIRTRSTHITPFDDSYALPLGGHRPSNVFTSLSTPQDNKIVFFHVFHIDLQEMNFKKQSSMRVSESPENLKVETVMYDGLLRSIPAAFHFESISPLISVGPVVG
jgi:hypothetical protein